MIGERRFFQRININVKCHFFLTKIQRTFDFSGEIYNVSEDGIGVIVTEQKYLDIIDEVVRVGDTISFQGIDNYVYLKKEIEEVITGKMEVTRIEKHPQYYFLGCKLKHPNADFERYVMNKKFIDFTLKHTF